MGFRDRGLEIKTRDQIDLMIGQLYTGKWNAVRSGGSGAGGRATILVLAFAQVAGCSEDEAISAGWRTVEQH